MATCKGLITLWLCAATVIAEDSASCAADLEAAGHPSSCLIQRESPHRDAVATSHVLQEAIAKAPVPASLTQRAAHKASAATVPTQYAASGYNSSSTYYAASGNTLTAETVDENPTVEMPDALRLLGIKLFGSQDKLDKVVTNSEEVEIDFIHIRMRLRIKTGDNAMTRLPEEGATDEYGIDTLLDAGPTFHGMLNIVDMGANYGVVPIALYKRYPGMVRAVVAEPIHSTYFFLRWNMYLNGVDDLTGDELAATGKDRRPGVLAVHRAVAEPNKEKHVCWSPDNSMNAVMCDCNQPPFESVCLDVKSIGTQQMFSYFGKEGIDFLKMDCEGCERHTLPAMSKMTDAHLLVRRLVGELHNVPTEFEDMACQYNHQTWMTKVCGPPRGAGQQLECNAQTRDQNCYVEVSWPTP